MEGEEVGIERAVVNAEVFGLADRGEHGPPYCSAAVGGRSRRAGILSALLPAPKVPRAPCLLRLRGGIGGRRPEVGRWPRGGARGRWSVRRAAGLRSSEARAWAAVKAGVRRAGGGWLPWRGAAEQGSCEMGRLAAGLTADFFGGAMPNFVVTVIWPLWCSRNSPRQPSASP